MISLGDNTGAPDPREYYAEKLALHGAIPASVDVTEAGQRLRFKIIMDELGKTHQCSILDVGCGYGAFRDFLVEYSRHSIDYTGVDICESMIRAAHERRPNVKFMARDIIVDPLPQEFDFVIASGLFQFNHGWGNAERLISAMWKHTKRTLVFNMLSRLTPMKDWVNTEFHAEPERTFAFCQEHTPYVRLLHDYRPNDFTVVMRREPTYPVRSSLEMIRNVG